MAGSAAISHCVSLSSENNTVGRTVMFTALAGDTFSLDYIAPNNTASMNVDASMIVETVGY